MELKDFGEYIHKNSDYLKEKTEEFKKYTYKEL